MPDPTTAEPGQATQPATEPQQPDGGVPDGTTTPEPTPDTVSRAEMDKVIGERQAAKERARAADAAMAEMQKKLEAMPAPETMEAFTAWKLEQDAKAKTTAIESGDVAALESKIRDPLMKLMEAKDSRNAALKAQLTAILQGNALRSAAAAAGASNPEQVVTLLRGRVKMTETPSGDFQPMYLGEDGTQMYDGAAQPVKDASTFVKLFLAQPGNENLVPAHVTPGSGARPTGGTPNPTGKVQTLEQLAAMTPEQVSDAMASMTPEERRALLPQSGPQPGML